MLRIVNWELIVHPVNWLIIFLVLYLSALLGKTVYDAAVHGVSPLPSLDN